MIKRISFNLILVILPLFILSSICKSSLDCSKIKNGQFYYYSKKSRHKVNINRQDSLQLETDTKSGLVLRNKIIWKSDCKFEMYVNAFSNSKLAPIDSLLATIPARVEIINISPKYYVCKCEITILNEEVKFVDTMYFKKSY